MKNRSIRPHRGIRNSRADRVFYGVNGVLMALTFLLYAWPLWFVLISSFSDPNLVQAGQVLLLPKGFHLGGYKLILEYQDILRGYLNSILYTVVGTALNLVMTICAAYPLSRSDFLPRKVLTVLFVFTMYFSGGLIPNFLVIKNLGLYDSRWAIILPTAVSTYNLIVMRTAFSSVPGALQESACLDGANDFVILYRIYILCIRATMAVVCLFYAVSQWNSWFNSMIYLQSSSKWPLQLWLREILINSASGGTSDDADALYLQELIRYAVIIVATVPILVVYPYAQKYFMKGVMLGSVKG